MRNAKVKDYWNKVYKDSRQYVNYISKLSLKNCNGYTGTIYFNPGITIICGLNGVGKSSIISSVKGVLGIEDHSIITKNKFNGDISAQISINREMRSCTSISPATDFGLTASVIKYIDSDQSLECIKYWEQSHIDEILDSIDEHIFSDEEKEEISQIIGKQYSECISFEYDDEKSFIPVYFKVKENDIEYDSTQMGIGEHFLFYVYYMLKNCYNNSIIIIEEPESYISVKSQVALINYIAKAISEKHISLIISSHSPYILQMVRNESIRLVINDGAMLVYESDYIDYAREHLGLEILQSAKIATFFVEDFMARVFLECILSNEYIYLNNVTDIVSLKGESDITSRLAFDDSEHMSHIFIGVYDGDMRKRFITEKTEQRIKWPHIFLPVDECVEKEIIDFLKDRKNVDLMKDTLGISMEIFRATLSKHRGEDHHDYILKICSDLSIELPYFIKSFYQVWKTANEEKIKTFITEIEEILKRKNSNYGKMFQKRLEKCTVATLS